MKTALNIIGVIAAMVITFFISTAGRESERIQIGLLQSEVKSLRIYMQVIETDAKLTADIVDIHQGLIMTNKRTTSNMVVAVKMLADQVAPLKPTARAR